MRFALGSLTFVRPLFSEKGTLGSPSKPSKPSFEGFEGSSGSCVFCFSAPDPCCKLCSFARYLFTRCPPALFLFASELRLRLAAGIAVAAPADHRRRSHMVCCRRSRTSIRDD